MEEDSRFSHVKTDPKFRRIPKGQRKIKIDKRFQSMFNDKKFKVKYTVDKRGRPVNHSTTEDLKRYYEVASDESESESNESETESTGQFVRAPELQAKHSSDKAVTDKVKKKLKNLNVDYARGEGTLVSDSSSDDEESEEEADENDDVDHKWGELDADADRTEEATSRLAACNMDWDRIRAVDLMVLLNSFLPPNGSIQNVKIYTSEFGKERMAEEEVKGPIELVDSKAVEDEDENEEGSKYHMEKLRQYQLNRLKYFYAVITCDSAATANKLYTECDGMEYESSATKMDLRFIPEEMTFEDEPKEICDKLPELDKYAPRFFTTTALQQAKVNLTWDETDPDRIELTEKLAQGKIDHITDNDLQAYLASSSDEDSEEENGLDDPKDGEDDKGKNALDTLDKYKALLQEINEKENQKKSKGVEMEISWGLELENKTETLVKKKMTENQERTPFQQYLDKRKEKKREKKNKKKELQENDSDSSEVRSDIDMNDPYFAEEFDKPEFKLTKKRNSKAKKASDDDDEQGKAELELLLADESEDKQHFSLKKIQDAENESKSRKKRKAKKKESTEIKDDFEVNVNDERFSALFTSHHYNIDPTDPHYKKTHAMEKLITEKLKRRTEGEAPAQSKKAKTDSKSAELNVLVKSVKRKATAFNRKSK